MPRLYELLLLSRRSREAFTKSNRGASKLVQCASRRQACGTRHCEDCVHRDLCEDTLYCTIWKSTRQLTIFPLRLPCTFQWGGKEDFNLISCTELHPERAWLAKAWITMTAWKRMKTTMITMTMPRLTIGITGSQQGKYLAMPGRISEAVATQSVRIAALNHAMPVQSSRKRRGSARTAPSAIPCRFNAVRSATKTGRPRAQRPIQDPA